MNDGTLLEKGARSTRLRLQQAQRRYPLLQLAILVVLCVYAFSTIEGLASSPSIKSILVVASFLGLAAIGQTLVVLIGGLDLSVPGLVLVGAFMTSKLAGGDGWPVWLLLIAVTAAAAICGLVSGYVSYFHNVQPLIATLGVGAVATGAVLVWTAGAPAPAVPESLASLTRITQSTFGLPIPPVVVIWIVLILVVEFLLRKTRTGRNVYLTGSNRKAAELALVPTSRIWLGAFVVSAVFSALTGVLLASYSGSADVGLGDPYLFQSLTAVIVGGTAFGARGDYARTVLGVLILAMLSTILLGRGFTFADQQIVYGALILIAVFVYARDRRLADQI